MTVGSAEVNERIETRKLACLLLIFVLIYLGIGLGFHFKWSSAAEACRETRRVQGAFVEPEVFGGIVGLAFTVVFWPIYSAANVFHDGTPFATPCSHQ